MTTAVAGLLARLDTVDAGLAGHAARPVPGGLTAPDPPSGERWDAGQVWAHLAEFIPYWIAQARLVLNGRGDAPVEFGRTKSDPERIAAIARRRAEEPAVLFATVRGDIGELRGWLGTLDDDALERRGRHPTLGEMSVAGLIDEFLVGHLEQHLAQLDSLD